MSGCLVYYCGVLTNPNLGLHIKLGKRIYDRHLSSSPKLHKTIAETSNIIFINNNIKNLMIQCCVEGRVASTCHMRG